MTDAALIPSMLAEARRALAEHERSREYYAKGLARMERAIEAQRVLIAFLESLRQGQRVCRSWFQKFPAELSPEAITDERPVE